MRNHRLRSVQKGSVFTAEIGGWPSVSVAAYKDNITKRSLLESSASASSSIYSVPLVPNLNFLFFYLKETPFTGNKQVYVTITNASTSSIILQFDYTHNSTYNTQGWSFTWYYPSGVSNNHILEFKVRLQNHSGPVVNTGYFKSQDRYNSANYVTQSTGAELTILSTTNQVAWFFGELVNNENAFKLEYTVECDSDFCGLPEYPDAVFQQYDLWYFLNGYEQYVVTYGSPQLAFCDDGFYFGC